MSSVRLEQRTPDSVDLYLFAASKQVCFSDWDSAAEWLAEQGWSIKEWFDYPPRPSSEWGYVVEGRKSRGAIYRRKGE